MRKAGGLGCVALVLAATAAGPVPPEAVILYEAACLSCRQGDPDLAASYLLRAIGAGFADVSHLRRDPELRALRDHPVFSAILAARDAADGRLAHRRLQRWRERYPAYRCEIDEPARISYLTALDETAQKRMRRMLDDLAVHLTRSLFEAMPAHGVLIAIPTEADAARILDDPHIHGRYTHPTRQLIARDAGRSLRHEFVHVLHQGHMDRLGQQHPPWVQEGLASLYEEYRLGPEGTVEFPPNDRDVFATDLLNGGKLLSWPELFSLSSKHLSSEARRAYPQLRSIFRFLASWGKLEAFYRSFVDGFDEEPAAIGALQRTFGQPIDRLESRWRRWLAEPRPEADERTESPIARRADAEAPENG